MISLKPARQGLAALIALFACIMPAEGRAACPDATQCFCELVASRHGDRGCMALVYGELTALEEKVASIKIIGATLLDEGQVAQADQVIEGARFDYYGPAAVGDRGLFLVEPATACGIPEPVIYWAVMAETDGTYLCFMNYQVPAVTQAQIIEFVTAEYCQLKMREILGSALYCDDQGDGPCGCGASEAGGGMAVLLAWVGMRVLRKLRRDQSCLGRQREGG